MIKSIRQFSKIVLMAVFVAFTGTCAFSAPRPENWAAPIQVKGIGNFYKVSDDLYRGKQPNAKGISKLQEMGIKTVINLRTEETDAKILKGSDITYERIPMRAKNPKEADIIKFLKLATDKDKSPVFVHCMRGADRTGLMCAVYRIAVEGWSKEDAIKEMTKGGYRFSPLCYKLKDYIRNLDVDKIRKEAGIENVPSQSVTMIELEPAFVSDYFWAADIS
ncbi:MAG: Tyrosine phosphatase family protein [Planctomycetes bacterium ADurb.Bin401]|nr:MAG: Tyrosine phosphatase family protein [Planctomycetes bacterium ADurb.Bin401]